MRKRSSGPTFNRIGNRLWRHTSVAALIQEYGRPTNPETIIREKARQIVAEARAHGWNGPPFDPFALASYLGVRVHAGHLHPKHDALIYPTKGQQLEIIFNAARPTTRQNFSICHEIIHTFFPDRYEMIRNRYQQRDRFDPDRELEYLCDVGATELLLPEDSFRKDVQAHGFGLDAVLPLREQYQASREAVIRRMVRTDTRRSAAVFLEYRHKPSEMIRLKQLSFLGGSDQIVPKLRIAYSVPSEMFAVFLPRHKSIPDDSCAYRALTTGTIEKAFEVWRVPAVVRCHVEAMSLPPSDEATGAPKAVALLQI